MAVRILGPGDEGGLEAFLAARAESSMFLRSNLARAGIVDRGEAFQGTYAGAFDGGGALVAVAACFWNGNVVLQAPVALAEVVRTAVRASGRVAAGLVGPWDQVVAARAALGLAGAPTTLDSREALFTLALADLVVPEALAAGRVRARHQTDADLAITVPWRLAYCAEALGMTPTPALEAAQRAELAAAHARSWILEDEAGRPLAFTGFNAALPDVVQIGGVWTPPELRGRGHARCAVAAQLLEARAAGATRAILFTGEDHRAARRAYEALGFRVVGDYGLVLFDVSVRKQ